MFPRVHASVLSKYDKIVRSITCEREREKELIKKKEINKIDLSNTSDP